MSWEIPTFKQFDNQMRRRVAAKYGVSLAELARLHGPEFYRSDWEGHVVKLYESGKTFHSRQWHNMPTYLQRRILRTHRALSMPGNVEPWKTAA